MKKSVLRLKDTLSKSERKRLKAEWVGFGKYPRMNIFAEEGDLVVYIGHNDVGHQDDIKRCETYLVCGETYTVLCTLPLSEITLVELKEFPGLVFNSVWFVDAKH